MTLENYRRIKLDGLLSKILDLGEKIRNIILKTMESLKQMSATISGEVSFLENEINVIEHEIENDCMRILSLYHPLASDFRRATGYLKLITDMERISDQCTDICEIVLMNHIDKGNSCLIKTVKMFEIVYQMFERILLIIKDPNEVEANEICSLDDSVDSIFTSLVRIICCIISDSKKKEIDNKDEISSNVSSAVDLLFIIKYIVKIGDNCANIAEWIIYIKSGFHPNLN